MSLTDRVRDAWCKIAQVPDGFVEGVTRVVTLDTSRISPPGWAGLVSIGNACLAVAPDESTSSILRRVIDVAEPADIPVLPWDTFGAADVRGSAALYFCPPDWAARETSSDTWEVSDKWQVEALLSSVSHEDANESGVERAARLFAVSVAGIVVAVAGYRAGPAALLRCLC